LTAQQRGRAISADIVSYLTVLIASASWAVAHSPKQAFLNDHNRGVIESRKHEDVMLVRRTEDSDGIE
jgi:hypothetical protein